MKPLVEKANPLRQLQDYGQSVWLDYIRRNLFTSGELKRMVEQDGLKGMTSNPAIFEKAITGSSDYAEAIEAAKSKGLKTAEEVYEQLAIADIQAAADVLKTVYDKTLRRDGYVSLEVSPFLAEQTDKTIDEARRLWKAVARENLMIKVPATPQGLPAIKQLISEGINVNITLLFSQDVYKQVLAAYLDGLEELARRGGDISKIGSVASFFVSRIDTDVDAILSEKLKATTDESRRASLQALMGKTAIANAKLAYQHYLKVILEPRWRALEAKGAHTQRLLWASTSTKNPSYRDVLYVEELIGKDTVNTIPPATFEAFREHGELRGSLTEDIQGAVNVLACLEKEGVSLSSVTDHLLKKGIELFAQPFTQLIKAIDKQLAAATRRAMDRITYTMPEELSYLAKAAVSDWRANEKVRKLWACDASLWTGQDESNWLGWLGITATQIGQKQQFEKLAGQVTKAGFTAAVVLGMGGSSLCPEVLSKTFGKIAGYPQLFILDSTDPAQIKALESKLDLARTLFIVSSKSGTTLEPNIYMQYFLERMKQKVGADKAGQHFIAITDPGSQLEALAERHKFRHVFYGVPAIGGRYSALSNFGMIPAAVMGVDAPRLLEAADEMVHACSYCVPAEENPGLLLGAIMGTLARAGRDKVTLISSPAIYDVGAWIEQLLAESTGKEGHGLIPCDREQPGLPEHYGKDRLFVYLRYEPTPDAAQDQAIEQIEKAGQPVVRISIPDIYHLGQEFFRWEFATAVAGSIIGINAFNQPDVEASKVATRKLTCEYEKVGKLPLADPLLDRDGIKLFTDAANAESLNKACGADKSLAAYLRAHLKRITAGDYFALLAYIEMASDHEKALQEIRHMVRDKQAVATCLGFGPRFLHSTGQAYKGGANTGVFLQVTCDDAFDLPVPEHKYTFSVVKAAQALGDFQVLAERKRRILRVHLGKDVAGSLSKLKTAVAAALQ